MKKRQYKEVIIYKNNNIGKKTISRRIIWGDNYIERKLYSKKRLYEEKSKKWYKNRGEIYKENIYTMKTYIVRKNYSLFYKKI